MDKHHRLKILLCVISPFLLLLALFYFFLCSNLRRILLIRRSNARGASPESGYVAGAAGGGGESPEAEDLIVFSGGEDLTVGDILEAPGEVIGRSSYGTVYRAGVRRTGSTLLLRFVRPACVGWSPEILPAIKMLGAVRHPNLVPLMALYVGPRGEKLFVHPFYAAGTLARFLRDGVAESQRWEIICKLSLGIAKGLDHLHSGSIKPIIHGNLKTNNILLDENLQPRLSDFGLHLLLNPTAGQEMLEASALQGYRAPELIKMKDASKVSDIYSLGVVLLEMLAQKEPVKTSSLLQYYSSKDLRLPASFKELVLERKISDVFSSELINQSNGSGNGDRLLNFFQLAMDCCSASPNLRPEIKSVLKKLAEIGR